MKAFDLLQLKDGRYFEYRYEANTFFVFGVFHDSPNETAEGRDAYIPKSNLENAKFIINLSGGE